MIWSSFVPDSKIDFFVLVFLNVSARFLLVFCFLLASVGKCLSIDDSHSMARFLVRLHSFSYY